MATATSTPPSSSYDGLRVAVFRGFAKWTAIFNAVIALIEVNVRGPFAIQTIAAGVISLSFAGLYVLGHHPRRASIASAIGLSLLCLLSMGLSGVSEVAEDIFHLILFVLPAGAALLVHRYLGYALMTVAVSNGLWLAAYAPPHEINVQFIGVIVSGFVGGVLMVLVAIFDRERIRAENLAHTREDDLLHALDKAERAARARSQFLANMSHEIRTPMNGVLGLSRVLVEESKDPAQKEIAETIVASGQSLLHILDDILDLSKLDAGALAIDPRSIQPTELVRQVVALMEPRAQDAGIELEVIIRDLPATVHVDGHRVRQVLTNLLSNALKFTSKGTVSVNAEHAEDRLRISVSDTGIGMDQTTLSRVFKPFEQAEAGTARRYGGTGLGLSICQRLCDLMDGDIWATSTPGIGSTFSFDVAAPIVESIEDRDPTSDTAPPRALSVLVAEDVPVNQMVVRRLLQRLGAHPHIVSDGAEAVAAASEATYDVVLMDVQMPRVDGLKATAQIRALEGERGRVPIIALTANVMGDERQACLDVGMMDVLSKPIDVEALKRALSRF